MPSFATEVKNELARHSGEKNCCKRAELAALLHLRGVNFTTENAAVARRFLKLLKGLWPAAQTEIMISKGKRLLKRTGYIVRILPTSSFNELNQSLSEVPGRKRCCRLAYLRGAFLATGSVNRPTARCHFEITASTQPAARMLCSLLERSDFPAGLSFRRGVWVVYLKGGEDIADLLGAMGADTAMEAMVTARNIKEVKGQVNRLVNCETANLSRAVEGAGRQLSYIKELRRRGRLEEIPPGLREAAACRLSNPAASLGEMAQLLCISKSAMNDRLRRLKMLAEAEQNG